MDFLQQRSDRVIRREISNIRDSYSHYWDILAELLQNSRDSITRRRLAGHEGPFVIIIKIDSSNNSIDITDNGVGISPHVVKDLLGPGGSDKDAHRVEVGEKGVGLTFAIFSCTHFSLQSRVEQGNEHAGAITGAKTWLQSKACDGDERPSYDETEVKESVPNQFIHNEIAYDFSSYCRIRLEGITPKDGDLSIFQLSGKQLLFLLKTKTACGTTNRLHISSAPSEFKVLCDFSLNNGSKEVSSFDSGYPLLHELPKNVCTLDQVQEAFVSRMTEESRRRYLSDKAVWTQKTVIVEGWEIKVYGIMFLNNNSFIQFSRESLGILSSVGDPLSADCLFKSEIAVATKGMPTGIDIPAPTSGQYPAYYKRCFFLVESDSLPFDLGRKSLHYRYRDRLSEAVSQVFSHLVALAKYQGDSRDRARASDATRAEREAEERKAWEEILLLPSLGLPSIKFAKHPGSQEASVAAIFHELIGAGILDQYRTYSSSYGSRYDAKAMYGTDPDDQLRLTVEFKHSLESIIDDFSENTKHYGSIHLLVAWDANERKLSRDNFQLDLCCDESRICYQGVTHLLSIPVEGIEPIPVILLRRLIERLIAE